MTRASEASEHALHYEPWPKPEPPADLPEDLKAVFTLAANPVLIAMSFCSIPERFTLPAQSLLTWADPLKATCNELARWVNLNEAKLRAEAPDVLSALQGVLGVVMPVSVRLGGLITMLDPVAADPNDASTVRLLNALRENSAQNHLALAHSHLDGISTSWDSLDSLRSPLSLWANTRKTAAAGVLRHRGGIKPRRKLNTGRDEWIRSQDGSDAQIEIRLKDKIDSPNSDCSHWTKIKANRIGQIRKQQPQPFTTL